MRGVMPVAVALPVLVALASCGGNNGSGGTAAEIERMIARHCEAVPSRITPSDPGYARFARFRALAEQSLAIRCGQRLGNRTVYGRFGSEREQREAVASIVLPSRLGLPVCVAGDQAYTEHFPHSGALCKRLGGHRKWLVPPPDQRALVHTLEANCTNTSYLEYKPKSWSGGCTAGSDNVGRITWRKWTDGVAVGNGVAGLRGPCATDPNAGPECAGQAAYYQAPARIRLDRARQCKNHGFRLRYFGRARYEVYMRAGNPFGKPVGWDESKWVTCGGLCAVVKN
jgi:hypothetical protein